MLHLRCTTEQAAAAWLPTVLADFGRLLVDHAHCEHKASVTALSFVSKYPDDPRLVLGLSELARDEAGHLAQVAALCVKKGLALGHPDKDPYVLQLLSAARTTPLESRVDRLLCCALIEARSCERLQLLAEALPARVGHDPLIDNEVVALYGALWREEAGHHLLFVELATRSLERSGHADAKATVAARLAVLAEHEAEVLRRIPVRAAVH